MAVQQVIAPGDIGRGLALVGNQVVTDGPDATLDLVGRAQRAPHPARRRCRRLWRGKVWRRCRGR